MEVKKTLVRRIGMLVDFALCTVVGKSIGRRFRVAKKEFVYSFANGMLKTRYLWRTISFDLRKPTY